MTIDVMFPYYGDVAMMKAAVDSVLKQEDRDFKLTIVDDGYPDDTLPAYFAELTASDSRIAYSRNEKNLGANGNYRKCVGLIQHDIVVIMGADDVMLPNYLSTVRQAFREPSVSIVQPQVEVIDELGEVYLPLADRIKAAMRRRATGSSSTAVLQGEPIAKSLISGNWLYFPSIAWRADAIKAHSFRPEYDVVQDLALALDVVMTGSRLLATDTVCFQYRRHRESDSSVRALDGRRFDEERRFFDECAADFQRLGWGKAALAARLHLSSRLNAVSLLPKVVAKRAWVGLGKLLGHAVRF
ncbi:glycosyltransferase family 2 protein [Arthrobacter roseus]|uniref:glycosyltransferase family 2 protein n=1 Tax=Arthrobacter roseus TaxID=136274 RepID=UPI001965337F|nr:glycosyltransferase family 2 protein [Arthrobacter roseus]MBM7849089.1 glycosyltransferase involved in cell wall biosynthesis [Arthrobacter roseus]